jgi:hypothetical protein
MHDTMVEREYVCLVKSISNVDAIEKDCGTSPTSSLHDNILNVHNLHMQVATTHYVATTNSIDVEVM